MVSTTPYTTQALPSASREHRLRCENRRKCTSNATLDTFPRVARLSCPPRLPFKHFHGHIPVVLGFAAAWVPATSAVWQWVEVRGTGQGLRRTPMLRLLMNGCGRAPWDGAITTVAMVVKEAPPLHASRNAGLLMLRRAVDLLTVPL